jgi:nuclease HARBI1
MVQQPMSGDLLMGPCERLVVQPSQFQGLHYSGHKRSHGIKFQSVVTPDGLIAGLFGPVAGSCHDSFIVGENGLMNQLALSMPPGSPLYVLYADSAYRQCRYMIGAYCNPDNHALEALWNGEMNKV